MTSGISLSIKKFLARQRSLLKRRLWPAALTLLAYLLYNVVGTATFLSITLQELGRQGISQAERALRLREALSIMLGTEMFSAYILTVPLAAVLAIEGFSWMDSRREVDFYESQPIPRAMRFWDICASGFLYFFFSYAATLEAGLVIAGFMGALSRAGLVEIFLHSVRTVALFLSVYGLGVLSAMLTGNVIIAGLAYFTLLLYEIELRAVLGGYFSFLKTYDGRMPAGLGESVFSPAYRFLEGSAVKSTVWLLGLAVLFFFLAFLCFRLRKNESAGSAVVFAPVRTAVRIAIAVLCGLIVGLLVASIQSSLTLSILWMLLFTLLAACIMQIIYEYEFRALFRRPLEIAASLVIVLAVFLGFYFDAAGYDRFLPDPEQVEDAVLVYRDEEQLFYMYDESGSYLDPVSFGEKYMHLRNVEDVIAIAEAGQEYTRRNSGRGSSAEEYLPGGESAREDGQQIFRFTVEYRMKNGSLISRSFFLPADTDASMMDAVVGTRAFREGSFEIFHDRPFRAHPEALVMEYKNGEESSDLIRMDKEKYEAFRRAYIQDMEQFSYSFARENRPVGRINLEYYADRRNGIQNETQEDMSMAYPVYPSFSNTIDFLKQTGAWKEALDYDSLPRIQDEGLSAAEQARAEEIDWSVFRGFFSRDTLY